MTPEETRRARGHPAPMIGTSATTGKSLSGIAHLRQSIRDILTTRKGTRVMRRDYGSEIPALIDAPLTRETIVDLYAETAIAIAIWEPRVEVQQVMIESAEPGRVVIGLQGLYTPTGEPITVDGIEVT